MLLSLINWAAKTIRLQTAYWIGEHFVQFVLNNISIISKPDRAMYELASFSTTYFVKINNVLTKPSQRLLAIVPLRHITVP